MERRNFLKLIGAVVISPSVLPKAVIAPATKVISASPISFVPATSTSLDGLLKEVYLPRHKNIVYDGTGFTKLLRDSTGKKNRIIFGTE